MTFRHELLRFLSQKCSADLTENEPLIEQGLIDSIGLIEILTFVEERTGARVPDDEVTLENFQTVASIDGLIQRLKSQTAPPTT